MQLFINLFDIGSRIKQKELKLKSMYMKKIILVAFVMLNLGKNIKAQTCPLPPDAFNSETISQFKYTVSDLYILYNSAMNFVVDVQDDLLAKGTEVRQVHPHGSQLFNDGHNQDWIFLNAGQRNGLPVYRIMNYGFRRFLTAGQFATTESFRMTSPGNPDAQLWNIIPIRDRHNVVYIRSVSTCLYLQAPSNTTAEYERYTTAGYSGLQTQQFQLTIYTGDLRLPRGKLSGGGIVNLIHIQPKYTDRLGIGIPGHNLANGANLLTLQDRSPAFGFEWLKITATGAGLYKISIDGGGTEKCFMRYRSTLNPEHDGIILWDCDEAHRIDQEWFIIPSVREENTYIILNKNTGQALTAKDRGTANGTLLIMVDYQDAENQRWVIK
jgi:hypothetical protein